MEKLIDLRELKKAFSAQMVLNGVTLEVNKGEIIGLIGPSGAGKSTMIKTMLGMEKADSGTALVLNTQMPNRHILGKIGYMAQSDALYDALTGLENLEFYGQMKGIAKKDLTLQIHHVARVVDLQDHLDKFVSGYSGGMKRRLSLAIALLGNPDLLILDEPTVGIDPSLRRKIWAELDNIRQEGRSVFITTHVMDEAELTDKVALLLYGDVIAFDTPQGLKERYGVNTVEEAFWLLKIERNFKMRILAISKKVLKELLRDKRTLAMMFVAPILIMWLMNVMFSASSTTSVIIAAVDVPSSLIENLDDVEHVAVEKYTSAKAAQKDLDNQEVDAILTVDDDTYDVTYANTDSSKTALTRQAIKSVLSWSITNQFMSQVKEAVAETPSLASLLPTSNVSSTDLTEHYDYGDENTGFFAKMIPILMGFMVFFFVFLISGMALLKERTSGTLDRLLATPVKRSDIVFGYMISYGIIAVIQTVVIVLSTIWLLDIEVVGNIINVIIVNFVLALVALAFGVLLSTLAKSEFQLMQFLPLVIMPQLFFSGIIPLDSMADWVQHIGKILPLSYSGDALTKIIMYGDGFNSVAFDLLILLMFLVGLTTANIIGLKRYRKV